MTALQPQMNFRITDVIASKLGSYRGRIDLNSVFNETEPCTKTIKS